MRITKTELNSLAKVPEFTSGVIKPNLLQYGVSPKNNTSESAQSISQKRGLQKKSQTMMLNEQIKKIKSKNIRYETNTSSMI